MSDPKTNVEGNSSKNHILQPYVVSYQKVHEKCPWNLHQMEDSTQHTGGLANSAAMMAKLAKLRSLWILLPIF